jgi:hypothetical protein
MAMTEEQLEELLRMQDLGAQEDDLSTQLAMAARLRGATPTGRNDWGSNLGRASYGISAAARENQAQKTMGGLPGQRQGILESLLRKRKRGPADPGMVDAGYDPHMGGGGY